mgnify:CR=1 FL=1
MISNLNYITNILKVSNNDIDMELLYNVSNAMKHTPDSADDILDSFSNNQYKAKSLLVNNLEKLNLLNKDTEVVIFGCWYGSVLIPLLHDKVKKIICIDADEHAITIGDNRLFPTYDNVVWISADVFDKYRDIYDTADIFINTSCEHMLPMKWWGPKGPRKNHDWFREWDGKEHEWPVYKIAWWDRVKPTAHFAFTSNDMYDIEGHINCVNTIEDFKVQLPPGSEVLKEDSLADERGTRFMLIGKL